MTTNSGFAYAQARLQARFAGLPAVDEWQRLAAARTLSAFLEEARSGTLRVWVKGFSGQSDVHDLEAGVRILFREAVEDVAGWVPNPWRDSVLWIRWLILLPVIDHLARKGRLPTWVNRDPFLSGLAGDDGALDPGRLRLAGAGALAQGFQDPAAAWKREWSRLQPPCKRVFRDHMRALAVLLENHVSAFREARPETTWVLRRELRKRLALLFHCRLLEPASSIIFLILTALDLERLRAELVGRALFGAGEAAT